MHKSKSSTESFLNAGLQATINVLTRYWSADLDAASSSGYEVDSIA